MTDVSDFAARRARFRELHASGCFLLPNPWDVGSARYLASLGFEALATTSSAFAFSSGRPDGGMSLDAHLQNVQALVGATGLPVNADFEDGHATDLDGLAANVTACVATGVAGLSIEDATGRADQPLYVLEEAVARLRAARRAIDATSADVLLVGRAECALTGHPEPLTEALRRLAAYAEAGADCLYAPGVSAPGDIAAIVRTVSPKPVNVLVGGATAMTLADYAALGVRRVSVGGALGGAAWGGFDRAARGLAEGRFDGFADNVPHATLNALFGRWS